MAGLETVLRCLGADYAGPPEPTAEAMLAALRTVIEPRSAIYVSSPITTGAYFLNWRLTHRASTQDLGGSSFKSRVIDANLDRASKVVTKTREHFSGRPVIDPTALEDRPDWEQHHYHSFWLAVISEFVQEIIFTDSWEFSNGCVLEYLKARESDVPVMTERFELLPTESAEQLISGAIDKYAQVGISMPIIIEGLALLQSQEISE